MKYIVVNSDLIYKNKKDAIEAAEAIQAFRRSKYIVIKVEDKVIKEAIK